MESDRTVCPMSHGTYILASSLGALSRERPEDDCSQPIQEESGRMWAFGQIHFKSSARANSNQSAALVNQNRGWVAGSARAFSLEDRCDCGWRNARLLALMHDTNHWYNDQVHPPPDL
jgi:hypothetical protein